MNTTAKRSTLLDLAHETGLSRTTVSYALNGHARIPELTRQKVREAADRLGYVPNAHAQRLASRGRNTNIDMFVMGLDSAIGSEHALTIQGALFDNGYNVPLHAFGFIYGKRAEQWKLSVLEAVRGFRQNRPLAVVCALQDDRMHHAAYAELCRYIDEGGIVVTYGTKNELPCDQVVSNAMKGVYTGTRHLIDKGHRDIGLSAHCVQKKSTSWFFTFQRALQESGIPVTSEWLVNNSHFEIGGATLAEWFHARKKNGLSCPTAMVVVNDAAASVFVASLVKMGYKIPDDISIVGLDDLPVAQYAQVPLTTIRSPVAEVSQAVVEFVESRINGFSGAPRTKCVELPLIERQSVRAV